jgi:ssDNA-binding Zn-finger/Zn-ribbon topoisomerase 1
VTLAIQSVNSHSREHMGHRSAGYGLVTEALCVRKQTFDYDEYSRPEEGTKMIFNKGCPRCGGDVMVDKDMYGTFVKCIQCSRSKHIEAEFPIQDLTRRRYPRLPGQANQQDTGSIAV